MKFGFSRLAFPLYDEDGGGGGAAPDAPAADESLSDHEAVYGPGVARQEPEAVVAEPEPEPEPDAAVERGADGKFKFKPRHRAKSQQAGADDVPRIQELTRRLREAEARADAAETRRQEPPAREHAAAPPARAAASQPADFPPFDQWLAVDGNEAKTFEDFMDARADWRYDQRRASERADESRAATARTEQADADAYLKQIADVEKEFPDFERIVNPPEGPIRVSKVVERAVIKVGPRAAYYLATHPEERDALSEETAIDPNSDAFAATVAATRRYLATLVAPAQRSTSSRTAADSTGSALALVTPTPKPPNPVRTGAIRDADAPPGDESSLADHERAYAPKSRRA